MKLTFFETPAFTRHLRGYLDDEGYRDLQNALIGDLKRGDVIPGTGGFRKLRWEDRRRGKGKRGGLGGYLLLLEVFRSDMDVYLV